MLVSVVATMLIPFTYGVYKAIEWRWWISGIRFGDVRFDGREILRIREIVQVEHVDVVRLEPLEARLHLPQRRVSRARRAQDAQREDRPRA